MWLGPFQANEGPSRTVDLPLNEGIPLAWLSLSRNIDFYFWHQVQTETLTLPGSLACGPLDICSPGSLACWLQISGFVSLHDCTNQFLITNISYTLSLSLCPSVSVSLPLVLFLWGIWFINTDGYLGRLHRDHFSEICWNNRWFIYKYSTLKL